MQGHLAGSGAACLRCRAFLERRTRCCFPPTLHRPPFDAFDVAAAGGSENSSFRGWLPMLLFRRPSPVPFLPMVAHGGGPRVCRGLIKKRQGGWGNGELAWGGRDEARREASRPRALPRPLPRRCTLFVVGVRKVCKVGMRERKGEADDGGGGEGTSERGEESKCSLHCLTHLRTTYTRYRDATSSAGTKTRWPRVPGVVAQGPQRRTVPPAAPAAAASSKPPQHPIDPHHQ